MNSIVVFKTPSVSFSYTILIGTWKIATVAVVTKTKLSILNVRSQVVDDSIHSSFQRKALAFINYVFPVQAWLIPIIHFELAINTILTASVTIFFRCILRIGATWELIV